MKSDVYVDFLKHKFPEAEMDLKKIVLKRVSFGLKDNAQIWHKLLSGRFKELRFNGIESAPCKFINKAIILVPNVDDLIILIQSATEITKCSTATSQSREVKNIEEPIHFLGTAIGCINDRQIIFSKPAYAKMVLH